MVSLQAKHRAQSGLVLANAAELGARIIRKISGNDIANSINGVTASKEVYHNLLLQRITTRLTNRLQQRKG